MRSNYNWLEDTSETFFSPTVGSVIILVFYVVHAVCEKELRDRTRKDNEIYFRNDERGLFCPMSKTERVRLFTTCALQRYDAQQSHGSAVLMNSFVSS